MDIDNIAKGIPEDPNAPVGDYLNEAMVQADLPGFVPQDSNALDPDGRFGGEAALQKEGYTPIPVRCWVGPDRQTLYFQHGNSWMPLRVD